MVLERLFSITHAGIYYPDILNCLNNFNFHGLVCRVRVFGFCMCSLQDGGCCGSCLVALN